MEDANYRKQIDTNVSIKHRTSHPLDRKTIMPNGQWSILDIQGKHYLDNEQCIELSLVHSLVSDDV